MTTRPTRFRSAARTMALTFSCVSALVACGGGDDATLTGYRRDPAPEVGNRTLPDLTNGGEEFALRADPGEVLVVYFGYTNCPDFCPTTMSDLRLAMRRLDESESERIDVAMVTVDPDRDLPVLADYVAGFFEDGHALGTEDPGDLAAAAAPFGVTYEVTTNDEGEVEVAHTTSLYAIDDTGHLALTWQFGVEIDELQTDLEILLDQGDV
jgi:protein SCO1/2